MSRVQQYEEQLGRICIGLRKDLVFTRQEIRGEPSYVVHDPLSFQNHLFILYYAWAGNNEEIAAIGVLYLTDVADHV